MAHKSDLWEIPYRVNDDIAYCAYISPLTENILREMSGVIATSALIAILLTFGFWYLLHVISKLRSIEEMKDDFTNNMTHELKTPIAIAYAANDSLLQFPDPGDVERTKKYLTAALDQLTKLAGLVENILAMSMERRKNLTMSKITVNADGNSIAVTDNGIGIPEKALPEIFKKFYRVPHGNKSEVRGYGIGLYYVKTIVEKHGWTLSVESKPNKGSTFTIKF